MQALYDVPVTFLPNPRHAEGQMTSVMAGLIEDHPADVVRHEFDHGRFCTDMDTPQDYQSIRAWMQSAALA